ncbi:CRISPR-associated protein Csx13 [Hyella patelloides LEGE 07179]|uniref:CRISPR-associated protein Csx13 n=1 Tax=Hyella patelloides LEGE 07179 TaxID=945734 RepID=A0A563VSQ4_9CYAN|nr:type I-MYXAN CRISPR-associated Cas8a1/Cmx1 [Hyella patelloides]VEP14465.1 CRISPR-associated protein Csx13 [Hyella patelloides LEGE 07179]
MTELTLSIFDPNTLLPHRAGIAGLALALSVINPDDVPFSWEVTEDTVSLSWDSEKTSDKFAVLSLMQQTYRIQDGYLDVPALNLDQQGKYTFSEGVARSFLQHGSQRIQNKNPVNLTFLVDEGQPEISHSFQKLEECYFARDEVCFKARKKIYDEALAQYEKDKLEYDKEKKNRKTDKKKPKKPRLKQPFEGLQEAFNTKGKFEVEISVKGANLPGLVECFAHGYYQESPEGWLALLFLPLACSFYQLSKNHSGYRSAVVIPEVKNIFEWVKRRKIYSGSTYRNFRSSSAGESGLRFLLQEKLIEDNKLWRVDYCEVYQLGKQQWDGSQSYLKQAVYRVQVDDEILDLYDSARQFFKPQIRTNDKGETWLAISQVLPWLCDNLITGKPWYLGFYEFQKQNKLYERKGLVSMSQYLDALEQTFFDAVRGAFSSFLREQIIQAQKQGRKLDYPQVTNKIINRLQRPSTQQDFAKTMVDFLSRYRSKSTRGVGAEIYQWLHKDNQWKQARDLALLAIASYTGKGKDGKSEIPEEVLDESSSEAEEGFEMSV